MVEVASGAEALERAATTLPDLALVDVRMPGLSGQETLRRLKECAPGLPVLMITSDADVASAVESMRLGAEDYLTRPINPDALVLRVRRLLELRSQRDELEALREQPGGYNVCGLPSPASQRVAGQVREYGDTPLSVLITGETGTGKEVVARALHLRSNRRRGPFVAVDCGAIPEALFESEMFGHEKGAFTGAERTHPGYFQLAIGGTLFLDEVGNLSPACQGKLLRALQEKTYRPVGGSTPCALDARVLAASNVALEGSVAFRQDLFFRLAEVVIELAPLGRRLEDLPVLARRLIAEAGIELRRPVAGLSSEALQRLGAYAWPGNVRELRNVLRRAVLRTEGLVELADVEGVLGARLASAIATLPANADLDLKAVAERAAAEAELVAIREALRRAGGNKTAAARLLKVDFKTLHAKMTRLGIKPGPDDAP